MLAVAASTQWQELHKSQPFYLLMGLLLSWLFGAVGWIGMVDCCNLASANTTFSCCRHGHQGSTMLRLAIISCCMHAQHAACMHNMLHAFAFVCSNGPLQEARW